MSMENFLFYLGCNMKKRNNIITGSLLLIALMAGCSSGAGSSSGSTPNPPTPSKLAPPTGPVDYNRIRDGFVFNTKQSKKLQDETAGCGKIAGGVSQTLGIFSNFVSYLPFAGEAFGAFRSGISTVGTIFSLNSQVHSCGITSELNSIVQELALQQLEINNIESAMALSDNDIWNAVANSNSTQAKTAYSNFNSYLSNILGSGTDNSLLLNFYSNAGFFDTNLQESTNYTISALLSESGVSNLQNLNMALYGISIISNVTNSINNITGAYIPKGTICSKEINETGVLIPACYQNVTRSSNSNLLALLSVYQNTLVAQMTSQLTSLNPNTNVIPLIDDYNNALAAIYQQGLAAIQQAYHAQYMINYINYYQRGSSKVVLPRLLDVPGTYYSGSDVVTYLDAQQNLTLYGAALINQLYQNIAGYMLTDVPVGPQSYPPVESSVLGSDESYASIVGALLPSNLNTPAKLVNYALLQGTSSMPGNPYSSLVQNLSQMNLVYYQYPGLINIATYQTQLESYNAINGKNGTLGNAIQFIESSAPNFQIFTDVKGNPVTQAVFSVNTIQPYVIKQNGPEFTGSVTNNTNLVACNSNAVGNIPAWNMYIYTPNSDTVNYPSLGKPNTPYLMCGNWVTESSIGGNNPKSVGNGSGYSYTFSHPNGALLITNGSNTTGINFLNPTYVMNQDSTDYWKQSDNQSILNNGMQYTSIVSSGMNWIGPGSNYSDIWIKFGDSGILMDNIALQTTMPDGFIAPFGISMMYGVERASMYAMNENGYQIGISPNPNVIAANVTINGQPLYDINNFNLVGTPYTSVNDMIQNYPWTPVFSINPTVINALDASGHDGYRASVLGVNGWMLIPNGATQVADGSSTVCITTPNGMASPGNVTVNDQTASYNNSLWHSLTQLVTNPCYDNYYRINTNPNAISGSVLATNASLWANGQSTIISPNGTTELVIQTDGNLVLYKNGKSIWASGTAGSGADNQLKMEPSGSLVLYSNGKVVWSSISVVGIGLNYYLSVQDDGNMIVYANTTNGALEIWATNTAQ